MQMCDCRLAFVRLLDHVRLRRELACLPDEPAAGAAHQHPRGDAGERVSMGTGKEEIYRFRLNEWQDATVLHKDRG